jgi:hypothetical protein
MHAFIQNGVVVDFPITNIRKRLSHLSLSTKITPATTLPEGYVYVHPSALPAYNFNTHKVITTNPVEVDGRWVMNYEVVALDESELQDRVESIKKSVIESVQSRLDEFAQTRGYDDIKSAVSYADDEDTIFAAEGAYCKQKRSQTWRVVANIMSDIVSGIRPMISSFDEIESELPVLEWHNL